MGHNVEIITTPIAILAIFPSLLIIIPQVVFYLIGKAFVSPTLLPQQFQAREIQKVDYHRFLP